MEAITIETLWKELDAYRYGFWKRDVCRNVANRIGGHVPRCGYEFTIAERLKDGHKQTMYLQNISNAIYRVWVYTDVCLYHAPEVRHV